MKDEITVNDDDALDGVEGLSDDALDKLIGDMPKTEDDDEWDAHDVNLEGDDEGEEDDSDDDDGEDKDESEDDLEEDEDDTSSGKSSEGDDEESVDSDESDDDDDSETIDSLSARLELMEAERDAMTAAMERERLLSDRNAGKLGALMQKIEAGQNRKAADGDEFEDDGQSDKTTGKDRDTAGEKALSEIRTEKVERAINHAAQDFYRDNVEFFEALEKHGGADVNQEFQADLIKRVAKANAELGDDIKQMSPKMASKVARAVIKGAFADKRVELLRDLGKEAARSGLERKVRQESARRRLRRLAVHRNPKLCRR